jgi:multidrug efflux pump subunit AcrB
MLGGFPTPRRFQPTAKLESQPGMLHWVEGRFSRRALTPKWLCPLKASEGSLCSLHRRGSPRFLAPRNPSSGKGQPTSTRLARPSASETAGNSDVHSDVVQVAERVLQCLEALMMAILLVFTVLLIEFRSFREPVAIAFGAVLALFGTVAALWLTDTTLNVVSFLGAIIGVGIVAKNGILMLDLVDHLRAKGLALEEALVLSGRRRLRPVLMTSLAAALGMLPLAYGIGTGADMLKPLAIAVIGALCFSVLLSLIATPVVFRLLAGRG